MTIFFAVSGPRSGSNFPNYPVNGVAKRFVAAVALLAAGFSGVMARNLAQTQQGLEGYNNAGFNNAGAGSKAGGVTQKDYDDTVIGLVFLAAVAAVATWAITKYCACCQKRPAVPTQTSGGQQVVTLPVVNQPANQPSLPTQQPFGAQQPQYPPASTNFSAYYGAEHQAPTTQPHGAFAPNPSQPSSSQPSNGGLKDQAIAIWSQLTPEQQRIAKITGLAVGGIFLGSAVFEGLGDTLAGAFEGGSAGPFSGGENTGGVGSAGVDMDEFQHIGGLQAQAGGGGGFGPPGSTYNIAG